jgi:hypothetical protein
MPRSSQAGMETNNGWCKCNPSVGLVVGFVCHLSVGNELDFIRLAVAVLGRMEWDDTACKQEGRITRDWSTFAGHPQKAASELGVSPPSSLS